MHLIRHDEISRPSLTTAGDVCVTASVMSSAARTRQAIGSILNHVEGQKGARDWRGRVHRKSSH
jgi:hypothetical protein